MPAGRLHIDLGLAPATALARGRLALQAVTTAAPVVAYGAELSAASLVLGAYQHAPHALHAQRLESLALPVLRRASGGSALWGSQGVLYLAFALLNASTLMACPPGRVLNRNVRGLLAGLRGLGIPAFYFGRDFVSVGQTPAPGAAIGWAEASDGRVLLEVFVAHETSFELPDGLDAYPERMAPLWGGKRVSPLRALTPRSMDPTEVLQALAQGYARAYGVQFESDWLETHGSTHDGDEAVDAFDRGGLVWSQPRPEAIGFVSAGVTLNAAGQLSRVVLGGDFFQRQDCADELAHRLLGQLPTADTVGGAVDAVYASRPGSIEGVRSLTTLRAAILDAVDRSRRRDSAV